jgi:hypothetical protein
MAVAPVEVVP